MKRILLIITCALFSTAVFAQKDELTLDEHNKLIYYQVADMPALSADSLYSRCLAGFKRDYKGKNIKPVLTAGASINLKSILVLYSTGLAKHESGEISYILSVEFKNGKYRYLLTDLIYTPYERNRYNVYERVRGMEVPFESLKKKYDEKTYDIYAEQIVKFGKQIGDQLKLYTATQAKTEVQPAKVDTRKW